MNFRSQNHSETDINMTPLIDVVFLLLIFFMVSTTFERESELRIALPEASEQPAAPRDDIILVSIDANEQMYIDAEPLPDTDMATLDAALKAQALRLDAAPVVIRADAEVSHQAVIRVMDAARRAGLVNITFATRALDRED